MIEKHHARAVRFFWCLLACATLVSLVGNIAHAVLPYLPPVAIQIGAAAVPPIVLLAAVHGVALAVGAGASGAVYRWAVTAVALIGIGAFALSFLALRDLMLTVGYSHALAWVFPAIIDTAVAVSTLMLVALGDKPARRVRGGARTPAPAATARARTTAPVIPAHQPARTTAPEPARTTVARTEPSAPTERVSASVTPEHIARARALIDSRATRASEREVATALAMLDAGAASAEIAAETGILRDAQRRLRQRESELAEDEDTDLALVG